MNQINIEFVGRGSGIHTVGFANDESCKNEAILDIFYEHTDTLLNDLTQGLEDKTFHEYYFSDFVVGYIVMDVMQIRYCEDNMLSQNAYTVKLSELLHILDKWKRFKSQDRKDVVESVTLLTEISVLE